MLEHQRRIQAQQRAALWPQPQPSIDTRKCMVCVGTKFMQDEILPNEWCGTQNCQFLLCRTCAVQCVDPDYGENFIRCGCGVRVSRDRITGFFQ